jgi:hypothetical protein
MFRGYEVCMIENVAVFALIGGNGVVDALFDFGGIFFFIRIQPLELLIEERPEHAAAQFAGMTPQVITFCRIKRSFANGNRSADMLKIESGKKKKLTLKDFVRNLKL